MSKRQIAIVLAALRLAQGAVTAINAMSHLSDEQIPVTDNEIDEICVRINLGEFCHE